MVDRILTPENSDDYYRYSPDEIDMGRVSMFLAGGITNCPDWQSLTINHLTNLFKETDYLVDIYNPRRNNFDISDPSATDYQIQWEFDKLEHCDMFTMFFCNSESDQPICMYELGRNIVRMQIKYPESWMYRIVIGVQPGYKRSTDVFKQCKLAFGSIYTEYMFKDIICNDVDIDKAASEHAYHIYNSLVDLKTGGSKLIPSYGR